MKKPMSATINVCVLSRGVGVNAAMTDSLYLAKAIIAEKHCLNTSEAISTAIENYEQDMFPRAEMFAKRTYQGLEHHFRATGGHEWAASKVKKPDGKNKDAVTAS